MRRAIRAAIAAARRRRHRPKCSSDARRVRVCPEPVRRDRAQDDRATWQHMRRTIHRGQELPLDCRPRHGRRSTRGQRWPRASIAIPSAGGFESSPCRVSTRGKPRFDLIIGRQSPGVRRIEASLNLAAKPRVFLGRVLLLLDELAHEIAQQLRAGAIVFLGCHGELLLQVVVDSEGKGRVTHPLGPLCYIVCTLWHTPALQFSSPCAKQGDDERRTPAHARNLPQGTAALGDSSGRGADPAISAPAITKHLRVLTRAGLISQGRDRQFRPCRIEPFPLKQAADWVTRYRALWEGRLDRLDDYLQELQRQESVASPPRATPTIQRRPKKD